MVKKRGVAKTDSMNKVKSLLDIMIKGWKIHVFKGHILIIYNFRYIVKNLQSDWHNKNYSQQIAESEPKGWKTKEDRRGYECYNTQQD